MKSKRKFTVVIESDEEATTWLLSRVYMVVTPIADSDEGDRGSGLMVISIPGSM